MDENLRMEVAGQTWIVREGVEGLTATGPDGRTVTRKSLSELREDVRWQVEPDAACERQSAALEEVETEALALHEEERIQLAADLLATIDAARIHELAEYCTGVGNEPRPRTSPTGASACSPATFSAVRESALSLFVDSRFELAAKLLDSVEVNLYDFFLTLGAARRALKREGRQPDLRTNAMHLLRDAERLPPEMRVELAEGLAKSLQGWLREQSAGAADASAKGAR
jgi:hypothetical protein